MTVTAVRKDPQRLTLTVEAEFDASVERIWQLWADPRKLELRRPGECGLIRATARFGRR